MRSALLALLLAALAGDGTREAIKEFERNFTPGMTRATRAGALRDIEGIADPDILSAFDRALGVTVDQVRRLVVEKDDATEKVSQLEAQIDDVVMRETERARKEGKPPGPIQVPVTLLDGAADARRKVEEIQRRIEEEYDLRDLAAESFGAWLDGLAPEDRTAVFRDVERGGLRDRDWARRIFYVKGLAGVKTPEASRLLLARLGDERDNRVLPVLIDAAADQAGEMALDLLLPWLADDRWQIRATTIAALGRIRSLAAVEPLIARLRAEDGRLRGDVAAALKAITGQDLGTDPDRWQEWWEKHREGTAKPEAAPPRGEGETVSFYGIEIVSKRVLFVIDVSNSMNEPAGGGAGRTKIDVAKAELKGAILGLPDGASFNIVFYHHEVSVWRKGMVPAKGEDRRRAVEFVEAIVADGNTNIHDALEKAFNLVGIGASDKNYELGADTVFLLSDGRPNRGKITDPNAILAEVRRWNSLRRVKIHAVGVGPDHDAAFMRALADSSGGTYVNR